MFLRNLFVFLALFPAVVLAETPAAIDPDKLIQDAIDYWRDTSSYTEASMTVHRKNWERTMAFKAWTKGRDRSLVLFTAPKKDAGSASLSVEDTMWSYAPKINKIIKIPPSMMAQSWMGSDFSYQDLSKADDIIDNYTHKLVRTSKHEDKLVYHVQSIPKEEAPVVWGREELAIREDYIILQHDFLDQDLKLVKRLTAREIEEVGGKLYAKIVRMQKLEEADEWTEVVHNIAKFGMEISDSRFTLSNLRNPRG